MDALLSVAGLRKSYGPVEVLKGIDFSVKAGEKIALIGPSGSGKSTCLRCMNFLETPTAGEIRLDGERIGMRDGRLMSDRQLAPQRAEMGMVFQLFNLWPHLSVAENVAIAVRKVRAFRRRRPVTWRWACWPRCIWRIGRMPRRWNCPAGSSSVSRSPAHWPRNRS